MLIDNLRRNKFDRRQAYADAVGSFGRSSSSARDDAQPAIATPESLVYLETYHHAFYYTRLIYIPSLLDPLSTELYGGIFFTSQSHPAILPTELIPKST